MTSSSGDLMTAGRFAAMTLLSAKALRIYADRGLLPPQCVDLDSGYRYYGADQVATGWLIGLLRSADLSLDEIADIIEHVGDDREAAVARLDRAVAAIGRRNEARHAVLARARLHLRQETAMSTVTARVETDRPVVSVLCQLAPHELDQRIHDEVGRLRRIATDAGARETGDPFGIFHSPVTDDSNGPVEIVLPVDRLVDVAVDADVRSYRLSGGQVATRSAHGAETEFPGILTVYDEVHAWITSGGRTPIGPPREIWHTLPQDAAGLRLTVAWPFVEAAPTE